jgi:ABC-type transport system involved in multi-copper enzyme maturation permease subunit
VTALPVTRLSIREAVSRRLVLIGALLSVAFLAVFTFGFAALYDHVGEQIGTRAARTELAVAATMITVLGLYIVRFLAALLAILLSSSAVATEIDSGLLHAVLARPLSRTSWLAQRWLAFALVTVGYVAMMTLAVIGIAGAIADYAPLDAGRAIAVIALELAVLLSVGLAASTTWSSVTSGVVTFCLFGVAWLAGIIELIGDELRNATMQMIGIATSLLMPSDALWRGASFYLQPPSVLVLTRSQGAGNPFAGVAPPNTRLVAWSVGYAVVLLALAAWRLRRRDL